MDVIKCIAIDDEQNALNVIINYCERLDYINLCATFSNPIDAFQYLANNTVDLIFLDINMPEINGLDFLNSINRDKFKIIFTTAYSKYAVESYNVNALDYLLKPITFPRFLKAINKLKRKADTINTNIKDSIIFIKSGTETYRVNKNDINFIKSEGNYSKIIMTNQKILTLSSIKNLLKLLNDKAFIQIHRSYIIHISKISKIESHQITIGDNIIPVGVSFRKEVLEKITKYNF